MPEQQYAVIGMGRFGSSVAEKLFEAGQQVMGVDNKEKRVEEAGSLITHGVVADTTDEEVLKSIGIGNFDTVIVAIGNDMQASILTVLLLKELGVKKVIAKAVNKKHGKVLQKTGADWIIFPERDMGERVAHQLLSPNVLNFIELSRDYHIEEIKVPSFMIGKSLSELDVRAQYNLSVIAIVRNGDIIITPSPEINIQQSDILVVIGNTKDLTAFSRLD